MVFLILSGSMSMQYFSLPNYNKREGAMEG
jgi:hypothetical protein